MAFCYQYEVESDPKLKFLPIMESQYYVLVSKTHPLAAYKYLTFDDLAGQKLILANTELHRNPRLITRPQLQAKKIVVQTVYTSFDSMLIAVQSGIGFTILPCSRSKKFLRLIENSAEGCQIDAVRHSRGMARGCRRNWKHSSRLLKSRMCEQPPGHV